MTVYLYHGNRKTTMARKLSKHDLVITSYNLVSVDFKHTGPLFKINWNRVAIDEAHVIRNHLTSSALACCGLAAIHRWALSGTPVHNCVMDVYSLLKFLHHGTYSNLKKFKAAFVTKDSGGHDYLIGQLGPLLLRRTKLELVEKGLLTIPAKFIEEINFSCTREEMEVYSKILSVSKSAYVNYLAQKRLNKSVRLTTILVLIIRLRQICNHPGLIHAVRSL